MHGEEHASEGDGEPNGEELVENGHDASERGGELRHSPPVPLENLPAEHVPIERTPYDPGPPVNVEAAPPSPPAAPPEPVVASAPQPIVIPEPEAAPAPAPPPPVPVIDAPPEKPKRGWWRR
jgi:ribonuclease E